MNELERDKLIGMEMLIKGIVRVRTCCIQPVPQCFSRGTDSNPRCNILVENRPLPSTCSDTGARNEADPAYRRDDSKDELTNEEATESETTSRETQRSSTTLVQTEARTMGDLTLQTESTDVRGLLEVAECARKNAETQLAEAMSRDTVITVVVKTV